MMPDIARSRPEPRASSPVEAEFDGKAAHYESYRLADWYRAQGEFLLEHLDDVVGPVVDVGCGTGWLLRQLLRRYPEACGVGVDLSGRMVEEARQRARAECPDRLSFIHGDWEAKPVRERVRDHLGTPASLVVCVSAFHYFRDPDTALRGMRDLLAPGGRLLLLDRALDSSIGTRVWDLLHRYLIRDRVRFYRSPEIVTLLERTGFPEVEVTGRINRMCWKGKLHTSLVLISAVRGRTGHDTGVISREG